MAILSSSVRKAHERVLNGMDLPEPVRVVLVAEFKMLERIIADQAEKIGELQRRLCLLEAKQ